MFCLFLSSVRPIFSLFSSSFVLLSVSLLLLLSPFRFLLPLPPSPLSRSVNRMLYLFPFFLFLIFHLFRRLPLSLSSVCRPAPSPGQSRRVSPLPRLLTSHFEFACLSLPARSDVSCVISEKREPSRGGRASPPPTPRAHPPLWLLRLARSQSKATESRFA